MTHAHAARASGFKKCCLKTGKHDGTNRDDYFQAVIPRPIAKPLPISTAAALTGGRPTQGARYGSQARPKPLAPDSFHSQFLAPLEQNN
ncbi:MAG: hypothetical protein QGH94_14580 [Phycisphaerae bacterium]|jgi:hypothetical protein|nr:hypothetical protein [Phycisphaerae bacterium]